MDMTQSKIAAARAALNSVQNGMSLGLGTGSTSVEFVKLLGVELRSGRLRDLKATCTSAATETLARSLDIPVHELQAIAPLDLAVDGADEIDSTLRLIKGKGGALLREKIVEQQARRFIVIADESKLVSKLGQDILPVEVTPFACELLLRKFGQFGYAPVLRVKNGTAFVTDEGNRILDVKVPATEDISATVTRIRDCAGVVETGFFPTEASEAVIARFDGTIQQLTRPQG